MINLLESLIFGACIGSICGGFIGICCIIVKNYKDSKSKEIDVENITKNILHTLDEDEETGSKMDYMRARPIV
jgi:hypothetical protein